MNIHLHNVYQWTKCLLGFHTYRAPRLNVGLVSDSSKNIMQVVRSGEECKYCGCIRDINGHLVSSYNKKNDYITILK